MAEVRLSIPDETHKRVLRIQGLFHFKEGQKTKLYELYGRVIERGLTEFEKQNK